MAAALNDRYAVTLGGAPVGEPALGPVAFMHRRSAAENPTAPLGHHTFDSTHIAMGVLTAALDSGPWMVETSVFHGREPDENLVDPGMVSVRQRVDVPGLSRLPERARGARARRCTSDHAVRVVEPRGRGTR